MTIDTLRGELLHARQAAAGGDMAETLRQLDKALESIKPDRLLTSTEAAQLLGIRSPNTILGWCRTGYLHGVTRGSRTMVPLSEVERIQQGDQVQMVRALDELHDQTAVIGADDEMTDEEMEALHLSRPGVLPWERKEDDASAQSRGG